jgi:hypothetical protein
LDVIVYARTNDSIQYSQARARSFFLEHAQLLAKGDDLKAEVVTGTEEGAEKGEESLKNSKILKVC